MARHVENDVTRFRRPKIAAARTAMIRLALVLSVLIVSYAGSTAAQTRVALVIGNSGYEHVPRLANPESDATDVRSALERLGFDVRKVVDAGVEDFLDALDVFRRQSATADVALVFYAGHGIELAGENYLIPIDAMLRRERDLQREAVSLTEVLGNMAGAQLRLLIVDACRNNPFADRMVPSRGFVRKLTRGLATVSVPPRDEVLRSIGNRAG